MKTHYFLISFLISGAAWAEETTTTTPPAAPAVAQETAPAVSQETAPVAEQDTAPTTATEQQASDQSGFSRGSVVRSIFTTAVQDREPVDKLNNSKSDADHIYFFTELRDMSGQTATHRWEHNGEVAAEVKFDVRGPRWRVWSSKTFSPNQEGDWKVSVLNGAGEVIAEDMMNIAAPAAGAQPAVTEQPATEQQEAPMEPPVTDMMQK